MKTLAFDLGRVLFDFDYTVALDRIKHETKAGNERIIQALFYEGFAAEFEKGLITPRDFYRKFETAFGTTLDYDSFIDIWCDIFSPKHDTIALVEKLTAIYPVYMISNINEAHFEYLYRRFKNVFSLFDDLVLSFRVKSLKPETEIYHCLKAAAGVPFSDIIYIDDRLDLIQEAKKIGLQCIQFTTAQNLMSALQGRGIAVCSRGEQDTLDRLKEAFNRSRRPLLVGIGNRFRSDDGIGSLLVERLKGSVCFELYDAAQSLENHLDKIAAAKSDLVIFLDALPHKQTNRFSLFSVDEINSQPLYFTHNSSLNLAIQYLRSMSSADILILGVGGNNFKIGEEMSDESSQSFEILTDFFLRNYGTTRRVR